MLAQRVNPKTGKKQYCLVSVSSGRVLEWYGAKRPNDERVKKSESRVNYFKYRGK